MCSSVVLPAPLGPSSANISLRRDLEADVVERERAAVALAHAVDLDRRHGGVRHRAPLPVCTTTRAGAIISPASPEISLAPGWPAIVPSAVSEAIAWSTLVRRKVSLASSDGADTDASNPAAAAAQSAAAWQVPDRSSAAPRTTAPTPARRRPCRAPARAAPLVGRHRKAAPALRPAAPADIGSAGCRRWCRWWRRSPVDFGMSASDFQPGSAVTRT